MVHQGEGDISEEESEKESVKVSDSEEDEDLKVYRKKIWVNGTGSNLKSCDANFDEASAKMATKFKKGSITFFKQNESDEVIELKVLHTQKRGKEM
jgi:hypothetical protein